MDLTSCRNILIYGGSFDPPHLAHVKLPALAMEAVGADAVAYLPAAQTPLKAPLSGTSGRHRLAMLKLALESQPRAQVLTDEIDRGDEGPNYTIDTLVRLRYRLDPDTALRLLIGADQLRQFDRWRDWRRVIELAEPLVMVRPPDLRQSLLAGLPRDFDRDTWSKRLIDLPLMDISSRDIRGRVARGDPIDKLVPPKVARYIEAHTLYQDEGS